LYLCYMKNVFKLALIILVGAFYSCGNKSTSNQSITYYKVPLVCGAAPEIGCGSRIKPFFQETEKENKIKGSWSNRHGTVIAIIWADDFKDEKKREDLIQPLYKKHNIEAELITDAKEIAELGESFKKDKWYKGMDIDQLSLEEAGVIANEMVTFAKDKGFLNAQKGNSLKYQIEEYFKGELVKVRTLSELGSNETRDKWRSDVGAMVEKYIGKEKTAELSEAYMKYREEIEKNQESCCKGEKSCEKDGKKDCCKKPEKSLTSEITCPKCGFKKNETLPTEVCQLFYKCAKCGHEMHPKDGDCCVFCSYGDHKCPSKQ
jgi:hypothetical protein